MTQTPTQTQTDSLPTTMRTITSTVHASGTLDIAVDTVPVPQPQAHEVLVRIEAAPINPSDLGLLVGAADASSARTGSRDGQTIVTMDVPPAGMRAMAGRVGEVMPVGNEGCGTVVAAGATPEAQTLIGKRVAILGGATYAEYRAVPAMMAMPLPDGTDPADGASCFVNPLTALSFTKVMQRDGHTGLVHTAAASNLGQMLVRICAADGIPLINIVRSAEQVALLKGIGATHVLNSSDDNFREGLTDAIAETGAFCAFDAIGGGRLASDILGCMEAAAVRRMTTYSRYGSDQAKDVHIYGGLDMSPTTLNRSFGLTWSVRGFLLTPFLQQAGMEVLGQMRARVARELTTTFKSHYSAQIALDDVLNLDTLAAINAKRTGEKYLLRM